MVVHSCESNSWEAEAEEDKFKVSKDYINILTNATLLKLIFKLF